MLKADNKKAFREGIIAGVPIALGYLAVSFSLEIAVITLIVELF